MSKKVKQNKNFKEQKTNVMRLLEGSGIAYKHYCYADTDAISGTDVARVMNQDPKKVFKTLVTLGKSAEHYVFVIPVEESLDLKKAAKAVGEKSVAMIKTKELLPLTGYIHGGCSPIGMKKPFFTTFHESAKYLETIIFSGGKLGYQVEVSLKDFEQKKQLIDFQFADIAVT